MNSPINRRRFVQASALVAGAGLLPRVSTGAAGFKKFRIWDAHCHLGGQGATPAQRGARHGRAVKMRAWTVLDTRPAPGGGGEGEGGGGYGGARFSRAPVPAFPRTVPAFPRAVPAFPRTVPNINSWVISRKLFYITRPGRPDLADRPDPADRPDRPLQPGCPSPIL